MCGIAGYLTYDGAMPDAALTERMCGRLIHRGPDGEGYFHGEGIALGHRRLSIIDVAGGAQPMSNEDGRLQVVFNGEIYNFRELRRELIDKGHAFSTQSDTEVLLHLYEEAGERMPEFLNGMFAFAIWDSRRRELFLARDRFGKKPLYFTQHIPGLRFCFASELKALTVIPGFRAKMNPRSIADFLALSYVPDPHTIYENVHKLLPGHSLTVTGSGVRQRRYWEPVFAAEPGKPHFDVIVEEIRALAADAVRHRLISDVPLGAFLSGGVDSSSVVAFMARNANSRVKTFSIGFSVKEFDELPFAHLVTQRYQTDHHEEIVAFDIQETLRQVVQQFDEPFGDSSAIPTMHLARLTRRHVTVALSGDGADELFGGYRRYFHEVVEERLRRRIPGWVRRSVLPGLSQHYYRLKSLATDIGDTYFTTQTAFRNENILAAHLRETLGGYTSRASFRERFQPLRHLSPLQQLQAVDLQTYLPGDIMVKVDRATMANSLECRSPWLDYRLGELACRLPERFKLRGEVGKHVFKQAMMPYIPREIITRPKMGFSVPLGEWFRTSLKSAFEEKVLGTAGAAYFSYPEVIRLWEQHQAGRYDWSRRLWNLLMLCLWAEAHPHE